MTEVQEDHPPQLQACSTRDADSRSACRKVCTGQPCTAVASDHLQQCGTHRSFQGDGHRVKGREDTSPWHCWILYSTHLLSSSLAGFQQEEDIKGEKWKPKHQASITWQLLRIYLFLMVLIILRCAGRVFHRSTLNQNLSDVFLIIRWVMNSGEEDHKG